MIPQKQLIFGANQGDCLRACIASILEVDINSFPNDHSQNWWFTWKRLLAQWGLTMEFDVDRIWRQNYWIASVTSKNLEGRSHAIVMNGHKVAHDPSTKKRYRKGTSLLGVRNPDDSYLVNGGYWFEVTDFSLLPKLEEYRKQYPIKQGE
jgi:hypothetical protein